LPFWGSTMPGDSKTFVIWAFLDENWELTDSPDKAVLVKKILRDRDGIIRFTYYEVAKKQLQDKPSKKNRR